MKRRYNIKPAVLFLICLTLSSTVSCGGNNKMVFNPTARVNENEVNPFLSTEMYRSSSPFSYVESEDTSNMALGNLSDINIQGYRKFPDDDYLYISGHKTLCRYNTRTGVITSLCSDPVCTHDTPDCALAGSTNWSGTTYMVYKGRIYFKSGSRDFVGYDMKTDVAVAYFKYGESIPLYTEVFYGDYLYHYFYDYDIDSDTTYTVLERVNLNSAEREELERYKKSEVTKLMAIVDDVCYFKSPSDFSVYTAPLSDMSAKTRFFERYIVDFTYDGEYFYFTEYMRESNGYNFSRMKFDGSDYHTYGRFNPDIFYVTDSYVYFIDKDEESCPVYKKDGSLLTNISPRNIYRMRLSDGKRELAVTISGSLANFDPYGMIVIGNYIYTRGNDYTPGQYKNTQITIPGYIRISMLDGSWYFIDNHVQ